ncbi:arylsulfatase [Halalkalibaculum sp. DA3122]|uniref:arylsulfatase n=1 Tax=Halalkalibaculum sp. DA3122 TaxID=3373607 RepID=UPI0037553E61
MSIKFAKIFLIPLLFLIILIIWPFKSVSLDKKILNDNEQKPNVILVMTDDQGYGELSYHGNPVLATPQLDKLAGQSLRLTDYHVTPMCAPTRGQLLTGLDAARNGAINVSAGRTLLRPDLTTMADIFSGSGYNTGIFGKWHLGDNYPFRPEDRGFQQTVWFPSSSISSIPDFWGNDYFDDTYIQNGEREKFGGYSTDVFFEEAMDFMRRSVEEGTPFFTYLPTNTPHGPLIAKDTDIDDMQKAFAESAFTDMNPDTKDRLIRYLAMIRNIDENMGRLMNFLQEHGVSENTILIFTTDNGSTHGPLYYNAGMRGMKTQLWEGGHRVPFFIRWPNGALGEPRDIGGLTTVQDVLPTLIDLTGIVPTSPPKFDGVSLAPVLRGRTAVPEDRMVVINYSRMPIGFNYPSPKGQTILEPEGAAVLWKKWRLLKDRALYNLEADPKQQTNVIGQYPDVAEKMRTHLSKWWDDVESKANQPQRVVIGSDKANPAMLTGCEWLDVFIDQQTQVMNGTRKFGYWLLKVAEAGEYEFELRRWPEESNIPLQDKPRRELASINPRHNLAIATTLPIASAHIYINNVAVPHKPLDEIEAYPFLGERKQVEAGDRSVTFTVKLEEGPIALHSWFNDEDGNPITTPYYVYVKRK